MAEGPNFSVSPSLITYLLFWNSFHFQKSTALFFFFKTHSGAFVTGFDFKVPHMAVERHEILSLTLDNL